MSKTRRALAASAALGFAALIGAAPAAAHVRTDESQLPPKGGYGLVTLIVPTESESAATTGLTITVPDEINLTSARTLPIAGWTATVVTEGERVSQILWEAESGQGLQPTEFGEFTFSAGPWPEDVDSVALVSDQTYSDGSLVTWNEVALDSGSEPEHPAPVVTLSEPDGQDHGSGDHGAASESAAHEHDSTLAASASAPWLWQAISVVSLLVALGTASALAVVVRRSRDTAS